MRIIKDGRIKELPKEIEKGCRHCDCVFTYEKEDVQHGMTLYPNCRSIDFVICPFCGRGVEVNNIWK